MFNRKGSKPSKTKGRLKIPDKKVESSDRPSLPLIGVTVTLLIAGLLMVFSSSAVLAFVRYEDTFYFVKRQLLFIVIGLILAYLIYRMKYLQLRYLAKVLLVIDLALLIYLIPQALFKIEMPAVVTLNGATRWIRIPGLFDIQPAELAKIAVILFTSLWLTRAEKTKIKMEKWVRSFKENRYLHDLINLIYKQLPLFLMGLIALLIIIERDLDTIVIIALTFFAIYFAAAKSKKESRFVLLILILAVVVGVGASILEPYRRERVQSFVEIMVKGEPDNKQGASFQIWNGLIAIGSGGTFGVGYGESRQKLFFLQEAAYTDSIFAVFAEEFGLFGSLILIFGYFYFMSLGWKIARNSKNQYLAYIAIGVTAWISIQAFLNIAANLAIIPFGGMPLPFFTYGGSNTITTLIGVGLLLNVSKQSNSLEKHTTPIRLSR
jgi:cell division protein FtsW